MVHINLNNKKLNFGAGRDVRKEWDNLDITSEYGANIVWDGNKFPYPIKNNTYDYIYSTQVLEHLKDKEQVLNELCRIVKPSGIIEIRVPHLNCEGAFADMGHVSFFCEETFNTFINPPDWRKVNYKIEVITLKTTLSSFGKWIPFSWFRRKLSLILRGIFREIRFKFRVLKPEQ